jgi:hypothetical protein
MKLFCSYWVTAMSELKLDQYVRVSDMWFSHNKCFHECETNHPAVGIVITIFNLDSDTDYEYGVKWLSSWRLLEENSMVRVLRYSRHTLEPIDEAEAALLILGG